MSIDYKSFSNKMFASSVSYDEFRSSFDIDNWIENIANDAWKETNNKTRDNCIFKNNYHNMKKVRIVEERTMQKIVNDITF